MATQHPRIGVTRDPELTAALEVTRDLVDDADARSEAGQVRRLALIGAKALMQDTARDRISRARAVVLAQPGVRPATRSLDDLTWLETDPVDLERSGSSQLDEIRAHGR